MLCCISQIRRINYQWRGCAERAKEKIKTIINGAAAERVTVRFPSLSNRQLFASSDLFFWTATSSDAARVRYTHNYKFHIMELIIILTNFKNF